MIKHVILDFGGVIYDLDGNQTSVPGHLASIYDVPEQVIKDIWKYKKDDLLIGVGTPYEFIQWLTTELKSELSADEVFTQWRKLYTVDPTRIRWDLLEYLKTHPQQFQIHLLSNAINLEEEDISWQKRVFDGFTKIFRSHSMGLMKPNRDIYDTVLAELGANAEECAFLDDLEENIRAAEEVGIQSYLYFDFAKFKKEFEERNSISFPGLI